jgi:hypothetical protein
MTADTQCSSSDGSPEAIVTGDPVQQMLNAMLAFRNGDFSQRLPAD